MQIAIRWGAALVQPLLRLDVRAGLEEAMEDLGASRPEWVATFSAGMMTDNGVTLPGDDVWRQASARIGNLTVGEQPPDETGAVDRDGLRMGSADDFAGLDYDLFPTEELEEQISPAAEEVTDGTAALCIFATQGDFRSVLDAVTELWRVHTGTDMPEAKHPHQADASAVNAWYRDTVAAVRRLIHRRHQYEQLVDPYLANTARVSDSVDRWSSITDDLLSGEWDLAPDRHRLLRDRLPDGVT